MKKTLTLLFVLIFPFFCFSQVNEINFNHQNFDFSLPPRTNISPMSIRLLDNYNNGGPTSYGSILEIYGLGGHQTSQLYFGGWDNSRIRYREAFYAQNTWSDWITLLDSKNDVESIGNLKITGNANSYFLNGNVGIGTMNPQAKLDLFSATAVNGPILSIRSDFTALGKYAMIRFGDQTQTSLYQKGAIIYEGVAGSARGRFHIALNNDDTSNSVTLNDAKLTVQSDGNIGIGTTTPVSKLDVRGVISTPEIAFRNADGGDDSDPYRLRKVQGSSDNNWLELQLNDNSNESFRIYGNSCSGFGCGEYSSNLYHSFDAQGNVFHSGNVGIGTTDPKSKLHVFGQENGAFNGLVIDNRKNYGVGSGIDQTSRILLSLSENQIPNPLDRIFGIIESGTLSESDSSNGRLSFYVRQGGNVNEKMRINYNGKVGIGTTNPDEMLTVNGTIHATEVKVTQTVPADYVFQKYYTGKSELKSDYVMPTLAEIENFTKKNHHLPDVPSAQEVQQNGVSLGEMSNVLLQKVEELTLYAIEQNKELERLKKENEQYKSLVERVAALEKK